MKKTPSGVFFLSALENSILISTHVLSSETAPIPPLRPQMNTTEELKKVITPCISVCKYNDNNYCIGCKRHMNEIFDWFDYDDPMRIAIMKKLIDRKIV